MRTSRRFQLRLAPEIETAVGGFAQARGLAVAAAIRLLVSRGLEVESLTAGAGSDSAASLAALVAAEHAVLMVASILPEGETRMRGLAEQASRAAEERLAMVREPAASGAES